MCDTAVIRIARPGRYPLPDCSLMSSMKEWREWLLANWERKPEIRLWLPVRYSDTMPHAADYAEEALRFGWVVRASHAYTNGDQTVLFAPWRESAPCTPAEFEQMLNLEKQGMLYPQAAGKVRLLLGVPYEHPADVLRRLKADPKVWQNFQQLPEQYRQLATAYVDAARNQPAEFIRRLRLLLTKTKDNKRLPVSL